MGFDGTACGFLIGVGKLCGLASLMKPASVYVAEHAHLTSIPAADVDTKTVSSDIVMDASQVFQTWKTSEENAVLSYEAIGQKGSGIFRNFFTVYIPGATRDEVLRASEAVLNDDFVLIIPDTNNELVILGTEQSPARIPSGGIQGVKDGENDGVTITFENFGPLPLRYTGSIPLS